ncbi:hypothetical protein C5615_32155 [Burkholderia cepacia]|uniref:DUF1835 domain-containing protein n=1 Tax=Burkholderia cepacia TaxID=292 RepID=A0A2S8I9G2_BURCE|nr:DUF1835 domain-containing protein [Burkholderia cepacia]PQP11421.1 hypothetical protein C5615_32155 [Burkholderia cepacia]HDR9511010.1 DUF1835 domain-containing protein [Burkholderia cepacia]
MLKEFYLVSQRNAAGGLRDAIQMYNLDAEVACIPDEYAVGPLMDWTLRARFLSDWPRQREPQLAPRFPGEMSWTMLRHYLREPRFGRLCIWVCESGADHVFLRMACWHLRDSDVPLYRVRVPAPFAGECHAVSAHPPEALGRWVDRAAELGQRTRCWLSDEFVELAARPEMLRESDANGRLRFKHVTAYDDLLLNCCNHEWQTVRQVVAKAMDRHLDRRNCQADAFWGWRVQRLIEVGCIEVRRCGESWFDALVRKNTPHAH